jgi:DNA-binding transcriptional ArsR family regulator
MLDYAIDLDRVFHALADRSRRSMVERLSSGPASVSDLARPFDMSLAAVVQHVQVLEACGLVATEKVGRTRICRVERSAMTAVEQWIADRRQSWETRLDRLDDLLSEEADTHKESP